MWLPEKFVPFQQWKETFRTLLLSPWAVELHGEEEHGCPSPSAALSSSLSFLPSWIGVGEHSTQPSLVQEMEPDLEAFSPSRVLPALLCPKFTQLSPPVASGLLQG